MSEVDRLKAELEDATIELERTRIENLKRTIAEDVGLPKEFALRIQGDDEDAMRADAETLLDAMPAKPKSNPQVGTTNPGSGNQVKETREQRRKRLLG